ncbi:unnamed protein product [Protopolystoma xenopodis]|uniref:Uncharacterized protein n=1 Tax=Protopolystoma xenopodis TaxID=117903 RepID=A0A448X5L2_9PLAT|nr:unnamed protein product [Protopolystoma xenopodis]
MVAPEFDETFLSDNLKFNSKRVLYAPKSKHKRFGESSLACSSGSSPGSSGLAQAEFGLDSDLGGHELGLGFSQPSNLLDICLTVLERHIDQVDFVGQVPYTLFRRALGNISARQLIRIESCNPVDFMDWH